MAVYGKERGAQRQSEIGGETKGGSRQEGKGETEKGGECGQHTSR